MEHDTWEKKLVEEKGVYNLNSFEPTLALSSQWRKSAAWRKFRRVESRKNAKSPTRNAHKLKKMKIVVNT
jgi:hypothetical protein